MIGSVWLLGVSMIMQVPPPHASLERGNELRQERQAIRERETGQLKALADRLARDGKKEEADEVLARIEPAPDPDGPTRFVPLPEIIPPRKQPAKVEPAGLEPIRAATARSLFALVERAVPTDKKLEPHFALADECLRAVLDRQPDHPEARRLLGYVPHEGGWATPYAIAQKRAGNGKTYHPRYGWVYTSWLEHLEQGQLPAPGSLSETQVRWVPADEADRLHGNWDKPWKIWTEHYRIETNVPFSEAIAFGRQLEAFHSLFFALLADVIGTRSPLAMRIQNRKMTGEPATDPHHVLYFATKEEYVEHLRQVKGEDFSKTLGFYDPPNPPKKRAPAYFFRDEGGQLPVTATLYHEGSHQLLFESAGKSNFEGNVGNFWVFEGLGTYFETLIVEPDGTLTIGGQVGARIEEARKRLVQDGEYIPIAEFVRLDQGRFNKKEEGIYLRYQEAIALAVFLMQARDRAYREPFLDYVKDAYQGRLKLNSGKSLEARLGVPYATLDAELLAFLKSGL
jgi:hypothetical protein